MKLFTGHQCGTYIVIFQASLYPLHYLSAPVSCVEQLTAAGPKDEKAVKRQRARIMKEEKAVNSQHSRIMYLCFAVLVIDRALCKRRGEGEDVPERFKDFLKAMPECVSPLKEELLTCAEQLVSADDEPFFDAKRLQFLAEHRDGEIASVHNDDEIASGNKDTGKTSQNIPPLVCFPIIPIFAHMVYNDVFMKPYALHTVCQSGAWL